MPFSQFIKRPQTKFHVDSMSYSIVIMSKSQNFSC